MFSILIPVADSDSYHYLYILLFSSEVLVMAQDPIIVHFRNIEKFGENSTYCKEFIFISRMGEVDQCTQI